MEIKTAHLIAIFVITAVVFVGLMHGSSKDTNTEDELRKDLEKSRSTESEHLKTLARLKEGVGAHVVELVENAIDLKSEQVKEKSHETKITHVEKELVASKAKEEETARKLANAERELAELRIKETEFKTKEEEQAKEIEKLTTALKPSTSNVAEASNNQSTYQPIDRPIPAFRNRNDLPYFLQTLGPEFKTGIELGVQHGFYAHHHLNAWRNCQKYYLVDLWGHLENYDDHANKGDAEQEQIFTEAKARLKPFGERAEFLRMLTSNASQILKERNTDPETGKLTPILDYIYVDARHDYCGCKEDIENFWPLLRPGGIIAGHDYLTAKEVTNGQDWSLCGDGSKNPGAVKGAVDEFAAKNNLQVVVTYKEASWHTWVIRKPSNWK